MAPTNPITVLVHEYASGDKGALDRLLPLVYVELRRIAEKHLRGERPNHTLQPTALVHEMYARLAGQAPPEVRDRIHFLSVAAQVMRQILIDHARTKYAQKRGGRLDKLSLDEAQEACVEKPAVMVRIDDALNELARQDVRKAKLIEMRFFGGLTAEESASVVYKRNLMIAYGHVGDVLGSPIAYNLSNSEGARAYYRRAVAIGEEIRNADPHDSTAEFDLASGLERLGMVDVSPSRAAESLAALQRSVRMLETLVAADPHKLPFKRTLALAQEYEGLRLRDLRRYAEAIASYRQSVALSDAMLKTNPADRVALSQAVASSRGVAAAMAMAGDRAGSLRQARATIALAKANVNAGPEKAHRQRYVAESTLEMGSVYEILAKQSPAARQRPDWQAARSTLLQAISQLNAITASGKPTPLEAADLQRAKSLLAEADAHLSGSQPVHP